MLRIRRRRLRERGIQLLPIHPEMETVVTIRKRRKLFKLRKCSSINT